jgi:hypothetical protein
MIDLTEDGDHFVLKSTLPDGSGSSVILSAKDLVTLTQSSHLWQDRVVLRLNPRAKEASAVVATRARKIGLNVDALGESILLSLIAPNGSKVTYALYKNISLELSKQLPIYVSKLGKKGASH